MRDALDRAMRAAGWRRLAADIYERRVTKQFELGVQFWIEPGEIEALISLRVPRADMALVQLGEEDLDSAVTRDPLAQPVRIERAEDIETALAGLMGELERAAGRMGAYADVDAFIAALETDEATRDDTPRVVPVVLAATGRKREARERARHVPGDFADRLERWMAGERPPPPPGFEEQGFDWGEAWRTAREKAREPQADRPQASWGDVLRTGRSFVRIFRGDTPPSTVVPDHEREWLEVALDPGAESRLDRARRESPFPVLTNAFVEAQLEPAEPGRGRVLLAGAQMGTVSLPDGTEATTVCGRIGRAKRDGPLELAIQLPER